MTEPVAVALPLKDSNTVSTTTTVTSIPPPLSPPPPGLAHGGHWGTNNYIGAKTGAAAWFGFLCFCLPGLFILLCPLDTRDVYRVDGTVYDASGRPLGPSSRVSFVPSRSW